LIPFAMAAEKIVFLFPGQGSQILGMGCQLADSFPEAADVFQEADTILDMPLSELCWKGPETYLNDTFNTQPALLAHSIAVLRVVKWQFPELEASYCAGHSMGEFAALVAAGSLTFQDALICVRERGRIMKEAGDKSPGGMAAILGMDLESIERICNEITSETGHSIWVANDNCPGQVVISGEETGLSEAVNRLSSAGARKVVRLSVSIPSHCPLMSEAQKRFSRILDETPITDPEIPIVGNVQANTLHTAKEIRADLNAQLISRVQWHHSMQKLVSSGVTRGYELGPGNVLTGLMRRIDRSIPITPLDSPSSFSSLSEPASISG
jgi:[acyl-carrier-protein] S-malonyltransferase